MVPEYKEQAEVGAIQPAPLVRHPDRKLPQSASVVKVVGAWEQALFTQEPVPLEFAYQQMFAPLLPLNKAHYAYVPV